MCEQPNIINASEDEHHERRNFQKFSRAPMKELKVIQLNITYLNDTVVRWIVSKMEHEHVHVFLLQEHRLHKQQYHETCKHLRRYFHVVMRPANIKNEAPSGGATILIRKDLQVVPGYCPRAKQDMTSNSMMACLRVKGCNRCQQEDWWIIP